MPSKTPKQAKFMRAIAHGWTPDRMKSPPSRAVAQEFVEADRKYSGGFAENRYWTGGLAAMDEVNSGIDETLNWLKGGHVNYYQEGGEVRPGHPEGPNPFEGRKKSMPHAYARWERENHAEAPPPPAPEVEPEQLSMWETLLSYARGPGQRGGEDLSELEAETGEAHGGRVRYQTGGLAIAAPAGGVPPWISPVAPGPEYMEEPQGYQFGGAASRYRGVPPQRGGIQRGAPRGGGFNPRQGGALAQLMQRRQAQGGTRRGGMGRIMDRFSQARRGPGPDPHQGRTGPGGMGGGRPGQYGSEGDPSQPGYDDRSYEDFAAQQRQQGRGITDEVIRSRYGDRNANQGAIFTSGPGGPPTAGINPPPSRPFQPPAGRRVIGGSGKFGDPYQYGRNITKPRPGPGMMGPPGEEGGGIPGGPRVPPNQRGYLQRQRMMNRPPANVGGGANRVGMQDQQGGLARALQRGTGRPPMSRRMAFGRGAQQ